LIPDRKAFGARSCWSVVIRAYNPRAAYLKETLRSVLAQDPDPDEMQVELMNDFVRLLLSASAMSSKAVCV
jgi:cellulose synthase/poly-beta-1,6-N-acetylglucosamine synthase-like glycosyltransferase